MSVSNTELRTYVKEIRNYLPCSYKAKRIIINNVSSSIQSYLIEHPYANMIDIINTYGSPEDIAASYIDNSSESETLQHINKARTRAIIATAMILLIVFVSVVSALNIKKKYASTKSKESIKIEYEEDLSAAHFKFY